MKGIDLESKILNFHPKIKKNLILKKWIFLQIKIFIN